MDDAILDFIERHPDSGLFEIADAMMERYPDRWKRTVHPVNSCRNRCQTRLNSLVNHGLLSVSNPDGKRRLYRRV